MSCWKQKPVLTLHSSRTESVKLCAPHTTPHHLSGATSTCKNITNTSKKNVDLLGIEPRTFPMLRENYTTKPQAQMKHDIKLL
jgi:hypothetical protein